MMSALDKEDIRKTFDSISGRYDLLNQILSFGQADQWRKRACEIVLQDPHPNPLPEGEGRARGMASILDLGCGTGKFLECFLKARKWESATGVDFSAAMLEKARETVSGNVMWLQEDFDALPFLESSFDLVISGFTLRSVQKLPEFLGHVHRILTPGGKAAFLDLTRPRNFLARLLFYPYLKFILPLLGWLISGNLKAYGFLSSSVRKFQSPDETLRLMETCGYHAVTTKSFSFGAATLIIAKK
jgi:demethylmenaquinone methyltransferase / 2-methoxy-6-polyprenyl-1,4-benzoquinol methylase